MDPLPATWTALCVLAFLLGAKHGLDPDHLATIDGLTRCNARANPRLARRAGALFSLGHGAIVLAVAALASTVAHGWQTPGWLEATGIGISLVFLFGLAYLNLRAVLATPSDRVVAPIGLKGRLLGRFIAVRRAWAIAAVGMLFALSFDTVSQAALFALAAGRFGGLAPTLLVCGIFVAGMLCVDGVNGAWISHLIRRADRTAVLASRIMALTVAAISLAVGVFTVAKVVVPAIDHWTDVHGLAAGSAVIAAVLAAFIAGTALARRRLAPLGR